MPDFDDPSIGNGTCCSKLKHAMAVRELITDILFLGLLDFGYSNETRAFLFSLTLIIHDLNHECRNRK